MGTVYSGAGAVMAVWPSVQAMFACRWQEGIRVDFYNALTSVTGSRPQRYDVGHSWSPGARIRRQHMTRQRTLNVSSTALHRSTPYTPMADVCSEKRLLLPGHHVQWHATYRMSCSTQTRT